MKTGGGGSGGLIVLNPSELRRSATRLRRVSGELHAASGRLRGAPKPELAPSVADAEAVVAEATQTVTALTPPLADAADELVYRALWADIADEMMAGQKPSAAQLAQFVEGLRNGKLVKYANDPWDAEYAGQYLAGMYRSNFDKDPQKFLELAAILKANQGTDELHGAFAAGFVESFGAANLAKVPRVIQALESWRAITSPGMEHLTPTDDALAQQLMLHDYKLTQDPVGLLATFSMTLAVATSSGRLSSQTEHDLAWNEDHWAVSQLLYQGKFGANFLKEAFQSIVPNDVQRSLADSMLGGMRPYELAIGAMYGDAHAVTADPRTLVLQALDRNPEGAALALSSPLPQEYHLISPWGSVDTHDPVSVLYTADWHDGGKLFADVYTKATGWANAQAPYAGGSVEANHITLQLADRIINGYRGDLHDVTQAFVNDLVSHDHIHSLIEAAGGSYETNNDGTAGFITPDQHRIYLNADEMKDLFNNVAKDENADKVFLKAVGQQQAAYLAENVAAHPERASEYAYNYGSFNQLVLNAHDVAAEVDYEHAQMLTKLGVTVFDVTGGALTEGTPLGLLVGPAGELIGELGPDHSAVEAHSFHDKLNTRAAVRAQVATAFYEYGQPHGEGAAHAIRPPDYNGIMRGSHLAVYTRLDGPNRYVFDEWVRHAAADNPTLQEALQDAEAGMNDHAR